MTDTAPLCLPDLPHPFDRSNATTGLCNALIGALEALTSPTPQPERLQLALGEAIRSAQVLAYLAPSSGTRAVWEVLSVQAERAGVGLFSARTLAEFAAEGERRAALGVDPVTGKTELQGE